MIFMIDNKSAKELRELAAASTRVVNWYPHSQSDGGYHPGKASVRGPFGRWFLVSGGDNGMGDPIKYPVPVADLYDDAKFAAAAMNNLVPLLDEVETLRDRLELLEFAYNNLAAENQMHREVSQQRGIENAKYRKALENAVYDFERIATANWNKEQMGMAAEGGRGRVLIALYLEKRAKSEICQA